MRIASLLIALLVSSTAAAAGHPPTVVFDSDMDFDDVAALAYLLAAHKQGVIDLQAVTVTNNGVGLAGAAIRNARCTLEEAGLLDEIPVADNGPTSGPNVPPVILRSTVDLILTMTFPTCTQPTTSSATSASELLRDTIKRNHGITVLVTGSFTNLAAALGNGNGVAAKVARVVAMAGAFNVPGGIGFEYTGIYDDTQDLNAWIDPFATDTVVRTFGRKLFNVAVDATNHAPMSFALATRLANEATTPEADLVSAIANNPIILFGLQVGQKAYWWDVLAATVAVGVDDVTFAELPVQVVTSGPQTGRMKVVAGGKVVNAGLDADQALFEDAFVDMLSYE